MTDIIYWLKCFFKELYKPSLHMSYFNNHQVVSRLKLILLCCCLSQPLHALYLEPIDIQSSPGELLYAEIPFGHAIPEQPLRVGLASEQDLNQLGVVHTPPGHLSFFVRKSGQNNGVITITSTRPIVDPKLNVVVRVQQGAMVILKHVQSKLAVLKASHQKQEKTLTPIKIVSEKDINLNLASTQATTTHSTERRLQVKNQAPPPMLQGSSLSGLLDQQATQTLTTADTVSNTSSDTLLVIQTTQPPPMQTSLEQTATHTPDQAVNSNPKAEQSVSHIKKYTVGANDSLWKISALLAKQYKKSVAGFMQHLEEHNQHAFIAGDRNRLRRGAVLNFDIDPILPQQKSIATKDLPVVASKQSGKAKYRLNEAQMSLVAEKRADSAQASAKKTTQTSKSSEQLALKVMTSREKSVKLQKTVTHLDQTLKHKDHRIQVLNTRLAQLQQQFKAQQVQKKLTN